MHANGASPLTPAEIRSLPGPRRVDRLRKALRHGTLAPSAVAEDLDAWVALFRADSQAALRVLVLELLESVDDPRVDDLAERALKDRGDGVRLEALRLLLDRHPDRTDALARAHLEDDGIEVRMLAAERLHALDPDTAIDALFAGVRAEAHGPREAHALDRTMEFFVEDVADPALVPRLRALVDDVEDPEEMIPWAIESLEGTP